MTFYGWLGATLASLSLGLAVPLLVTFLQTSEVPRFPTAILCTTIMLVAALSATSGLVLDLVTHHRRETRRLAYLRIPGLAARTQA